MEDSPKTSFSREIKAFRVGVENCHEITGNTGTCRGLQKPIPQKCSSGKSSRASTLELQTKRAQVELSNMLEKGAISQTNR